MTASIDLLPDNVDRQLRLRDHIDGLDQALTGAVEVANARREVMRRQFMEEAAWSTLRGPSHPLSRRGMQRQAVAATNARILAETRLRMLRDAQAWVAA